MSQDLALFSPLGLAPSVLPQGLPPGPCATPRPGLQQRAPHRPGRRQLRGPGHVQLRAPGPR
eukprot:1119575-Alexandrium_andersonii.AAC.1